MPTEIEHQAFGAVASLAARSTTPLIQESGDKAAIYGTGTFFCDKNGYYLVTADHVANRFLDSDLGIPASSSGSTVWFPGQGVMSRTIKYDVAVIRFENSETVEMLKSGWTFLSMDSVWTGKLPKDSAFLLYGFPRALSVKKGEVLHGPSASFVAPSFSGSRTGFENDPYDPDVDLLLEHSFRGVAGRSNQIVPTPDFHGMSGCSVWAVPPIPVESDTIWSPNTHARIVAIQTSYAKGHWIRTRKWFVVQKILDELNSIAAT